MTPRLFAKLGNRLIEHKKLLWVISIVSFGSIGLAALAVQQFNIKNVSLAVMAIPVVVLLFSWGFLLSIYWFSIDGKMNPEKIESYSGVKKHINLFFAWYGAIFLSLWYLLAVFGFPLWAFDVMTRAQ